MSIKTDRSTKETGWIRDGHTVEIERAGDQIHCNLMHPSSCAVDREEIHADHQAKPIFEITHYKCMIGFEEINIGLGIDNHWSNDEPSEPLPWDWDELDEVYDDGVGCREPVEIEYWVTYGWQPSGPWGPEEYEWYLSWRVVKEGRDIGLAEPDVIEMSHGHPQED